MPTICLFTLVVFYAVDSTAYFCSVQCLYSVRGSSSNALLLTVGKLNIYIPPVILARTSGGVKMLLGIISEIDHS